MKSRILEYLSGLAAENAAGGGDMTEVLRRDLKQAAGLDDDAIRQRAGMVLKNILHGYSNFAVSTIDSFVHRLVRNFARELELPVNFDVEMDQDKLISKSIDMLLARVGSDQALTKTLVKFVETRMEEERSWNVERDLKNITGILLQENSLDAIDRIRDLGPDDFLKTHQGLNKGIHEMERKIADTAAQAMKLFHDNKITQDDLFQKKSGIWGFFERIANRDFSKPEPNKHVEKMLETGNWANKACDASTAGTIEALIPELTRLLDETTRVIHELLPQVNLFRLIDQNIFPLAVLSAIEQMMQEFRENENMVHISEFNKRISNIIGDEPVPFIYERIGEKYRHFLVDEFQDTSVLQWQNLLPLYENSLAANNFNMIVGDGKQAIYRWRSGEVEQFAALPEIYHKPGQPAQPGREALLRQHFDEKFLKTNYRSLMEIVDFNNQFFELAAQRLPDYLRKIYHEHAQQYDRNKTGGSVRLEFYRETENDAQYELQRVLSLVKEFHIDYALSEITILTRNNKNAAAVARFLLENGHSVVTSEALMLISSEQVRFIINMLYYLSFPGDPVRAADVLIFLFRKNNLPFSELHPLFGKCIEIHRDRKSAKTLQEIINKDLGYVINWQKLMQLNLYEMVSAIIDSFQLDPEGANAFIRFFKDCVLKFSSKNEEVLTDFLEYWEDEGHKDSIIIPEKTEAVRVMTIHKAKGLQFPVVIFPFTTSNNMLGQNELWVEPALDEFPQLNTALVKTTKILGETKFESLYHQETDKTFLDQLNVLYVAMTRPKEKLVVLMKDKHNPKGIWGYKKSYPDIADLFYDYLQQNQLWENEKGTYIFGDSDARNPDNKARELVAKQEETTVAYDKGNWKENISIRFSSFKNWDFEGEGTRRDFGIMVHNILAGIRTREDIPVAVGRAVIDGDLEEKLRPVMEKEIEQIIGNPEIAGFFDAEKEIITERDILLESGDIIRPDRVVLDEKETSVIDYKTGQPKAEHRQQLDDYAATLRQMGCTNLRKYLIYLHLEKGALKVVDWE